MKFRLFSTDLRFSILQVATSYVLFFLALQMSAEDELLKEAKTLYEYVRQNLKINSDGTADLNHKAAPPEFDLTYLRISERKTYSIITDDTKERFTVRLSSERARNIRMHEIGETVEKVSSNNDCCYIAVIFGGAALPVIG